MTTNVPAPNRILMPELDGTVSADEESAFFESLHQSNGTTRMTSSNRLNDVNAAIASHLPNDSRVEVLDVGVSSGISTLEWLLSLEALGRTCAMTACDRVLNARLYRFFQLQVLAECEGYVLVIHNGRRAFTRPTHQVASWRNTFARAAFRLGDMTVKLVSAAGAGRQVRLVTRRLQARSDVKFVEHDIFSPAPDWNGRFHLVRVANLLNRAYFPEPVLRVGLRNVGDWVQEGGLLVVTRTGADGQNDASLFRREAAGLRIIRRLGAGSEVEALVAPVVP